MHLHANVALEDVARVSSLRSRFGGDGGVAFLSPLSLPAPSFFFWYSACSRSYFSHWRL
jgi:hypothetical protein